MLNLDLVDLVSDGTRTAVSRLCLTHQSTSIPTVAYIIILYTTSPDFLLCSHHINGH